MSNNNRNQGFNKKPQQQHSNNNNRNGNSYGGNQRGQSTANQTAQNAGNNAARTTLPYVGNQRVQSSANQTAQTAGNSSSSNAKLFPNAVDVNCKTKDFKSSQAAIVQDPRFGTVGTKVPVVANYVHLSERPDKVYEYAVIYGPIKKREKADISQGSVDDPDQAGAQDKTQANDDRNVNSRKEKSRIFESLKASAPLNNMSDWATTLDILWTLSPVPTNHSEEGKSRHRINDFSYKAPNGREKKLLFVDFELKKTMDFSKGTVDLAGDQKAGQSHHPTELINALNAIVSRHVCEQSEDIFVVGLNKFFLPKMSKSIGRLQLMRGYSTSVRPGYDDVFLNINTVASPFYKAMLVSDFMVESEQFVKDYGPLSKLLKNKKVRLMYKIRPGKDAATPTYDPNEKANQSRTITGLGYPCNKQRIIINGQTTTVAQFFQNKYGNQLESPFLPAINIGPGAKDEIKKANKKLEQQDRLNDKTEILNERANWVPPELLQLEANQPFGRRLNGDDTKAMLSFAVKRPAQNQNLIKSEGLQQMQINAENTSLGALQMVIDNNFIEIPGRILPSPQVQYHFQGPKDRESKVGAAQTPQEANWWMKSKDDKLFRPGTKGQPLGGVYDFRSQQFPPGAPGSLKSIVDELQNKLHQRGLAVLPTDQMFTGTCSVDRPAVQKLLNCAGNEYVLLFILRKKSVEDYALLKSMADRFGCQTVSVAAETVRNGLKNSVAEGLALKVNIKRKGQNHQVLTPAQGSSTQNKSAFHSIQGNTMVMGADVIHPSGGAVPGCPSIAAVVASNDRSFSNFPGSVRLQPSRMEGISKENMQSMVEDRLIAWNMEHKSGLPQRIVFYRDGVSESQYVQVKTTESRAIGAAWNAVAKRLNITPKFPLQLTIIVCGKRHNTRFYPKREGDTYPDKFDGHPGMQSRTLLNGNLKPGLVVDRVISRPVLQGDETFDFFLQSHSALKGTARSCHYIVLGPLEGFEKGQHFTADQIQELTHALCYNYAKATKGVSYACPAYYADRLCTRASLYLHDFLSGKYEGRDLPVMGQNDTREKEENIHEFRARMVEWVGQHAAWKVKDRSNPWHENLDDTMFYL